MERYISIKVILDDLLQHPLLKDVTFERAVNYTQEFIRIVGMPRAFEERVAKLEIKDYRAALPCDFESMIQVRAVKENCKDYKVLRETTDSFHLSYNKQDSFDVTYKLQGNAIYTSMKEGLIEIVYNAVVVDSEGYPMIPDNSSFVRALEFYIKKQVFTVLFDLGQINQQVYTNVCQEYAWYVGQAQSDLVRPTVDQMESITNMWNTLIPRVREHSRGFVNNGSKEYIKVQ
jgi:hypothetical protein